MVRAQKKKQEYLSPVERENLESEKKELETTLAELEESGKGTQAEQIDRSRIKAEISRLDHAIEIRTPGRVRAIEKDRLHKEEKELEEKIAEGMPTKYEMRRPTENPGAVRKHMAWCNRNEGRIERYREIQRLLRPFEPKSIENLRKEK